MIRRIILVSAYFFIFVLFVESLSARQVKLLLNGGISKDMRSQTSNRWNSGFNVGAQVFISPTGKLSFGGRAAYHSRGIDGEGWVTDLFPSNYRYKNASGTQTVIELAPSLRYELTPSLSPVSVSLQAGGGLFLVSESEISITATFSSPTVSGEETRVYSASSLTGIGVQLGLPVSFLGRFEVLPLYCAYNGGGDWYNFYALNIGFSLGL